MITDERRALMIKAGGVFIDECMKYNLTSEEICSTLSCLLTSYVKTAEEFGEAMKGLN